jgi:serine protease Do
MNWYAAGKGSYLGIGVQEIDPEHARKLKIAEPHGVEVTHVGDDSPAAKAGLKEGDVVLEFNGQRVEGVEQFVRLVRETPPGRTVKLLINRDGNTQTVSATVGDHKAFPPHMDPKFAEDLAKMGEEMKREFGDGSKFQQEMQNEFGPDSKFRQDMERQFGPDSQFRRDMQKFKEDMKNMHWEFGVQDMAEGPAGRGPRLGIETEPMGSQLAEFFGVKQGVLVRSVAEGSPAAKAGIKAGDVIVRVGGAEVASAGQITKLLRETEAGKPVPVTVVRNKQETTVNVTPGGRPGAGH